jgi:flagellum-specific peptidoglycan hydrolase FlgJ
LFAIVCFENKKFYFCIVQTISDTKNVAKMNPKSIQPFQQQALRVRRRIGDGIQQHWLKMALLGAAAYMSYQKDMNIDLQLNHVPAAVVQSIASQESKPAALPTAVPTRYEVGAKAVNTSLAQPQPKPARAAVPTAERVNVSNLANTYSNLTNSDKGASTKEDKTARLSKKRKQKKYVERFAKVAQMEMEKYGIPASITLAQGLLESNVGESKLASRNNNHFGIKCFSRSCHKGHCSNFTDDSHKDFFRVYKSAWESYRAHSLLLKRNDRYAPLFKLRSTDYRSWAKGLKKAGYATDPKYADKIVNLIEDLELNRFDR